MAEQKFYVTLDRAFTSPLYCKSVMDSTSWKTWKKKEMKDKFTPVVVELIVNPITGGASAIMIKNEFQKEASE